MLLELFIFQIDNIRGVALYLLSQKLRIPTRCVVTNKYVKVLTNESLFGKACKNKNSIAEKQTAINRVVHNKISCSHK